MTNTTHQEDGRTPLQELYVRFCRIWGNSRPLVSARALAPVIAVLGVPPSEVSDEQLRALNADWVHGDAERPFYDEALNRKYQRITA